MSPVVVAPELAVAALAAGGAHVVLVSALVTAVAAPVAVFFLWRAAHNAKPLPVETAEILLEAPEPAAEEETIAVVPAVAPAIIVADKEPPVHKEEDQDFNEALSPEAPPKVVVPAAAKEKTEAPSEKTEEPAAAAPEKPMGVDDPKVEKTPPPPRMMRTSVATAQGERTHMEDAHFVTLDAPGALAYCGVFDGCGGGRASTLASTGVRDRLLKRPPGDAKRQQNDLVSVLAAVEKDILAKAAKGGRWPDATTAVVAAIFTEEANNNGKGTTKPKKNRKTKYLSVAWVGDSRCVLATADARGVVTATQLTRDHNASDAREAKRVRAAGGKVGRSHKEASATGARKAMGALLGPAVAFKTNANNPKRVFPGNITLTRALGGLPLKRATPRLVLAEPEAVLKRPLEASARFLLVASDGVFEGVSAQKAVDVVADAMAASEKKQQSKKKTTTTTTPKTTAQTKNGGLSSSSRADATWADDLVRAAQAAGSTDNLTAVVIDLRDLDAVDAAA